MRFGLSLLVVGLLVQSRDDGLRALLAGDYRRAAELLRPYAEDTRLFVGTVAVPSQWSGDIPIRVRNAQIDPVDLSVSYEFVNEAADVTAYEVSITRHFADGSVLVSTQGQDWFSSIGYSAARAVAYSLYESWLPGYF